MVRGSTTGFGIAPSGQSVDWRLTDRRASGRRGSLHNWPLSRSLAVRASDRRGSLDKFNSLVLRGHFYEASHDPNWRRIHGNSFGILITVGKGNIQSPQEEEIEANAVAIRYTRIRAGIGTMRLEDIPNR